MEKLKDAQSVYREAKGALAQEEIRLQELRERGNELFELRIEVSDQSDQAQKAAESALKGLAAGREKQDAVFTARKRLRELLDQVSDLDAMIAAVEAEIKTVEAAKERATACLKTAETSVYAAAAAREAEACKKAAGHHVVRGYAAHRRANPLSNISITEYAGRLFTDLLPLPRSEAAEQLHEDLRSELLD